MRNELPRYVVGVDVARTGSKDTTAVVVMKRDPETGRLIMLEHRTIEKVGKRTFQVIQGGRW